MKRIVVVVTLAAMLLAGCTNASSEPTQTKSTEIAIAPTESQPEPTDTPVSTATLEPTPANLVTTPQEIYGVWRCVLASGVCGAHYKFMPDGRYNGARDRRMVENNPEFFGEYWFEENRLHIRQIEGICLKATGVYELHWLESGNIKMNLIEDSCGPRRRFLDYELEFRPPLE